MRALVGHSRRVPLRAFVRSSRGAACISRHWKLHKAHLGVNAPRFDAIACAGSHRAASSLAASAQKLHEAFFGQEVIAKLAEEADAPVDQEAFLVRLRQELATSGLAVSEELEVVIAGESLVPGPGRKHVSVTTPTGPGGGPATRSVKMMLPSIEDISELLAERQQGNPGGAMKPEEIADVLEKYLQEKLLGKAADHVALLAAWGPKTLGDASGEFAEIVALVSESLGAHKAALKLAKEDFQFEVPRRHAGRECLVMPPSNFALLGLKDALHVLLEGFRVLLVVQPRFFPHFKEIKDDLVACGLPQDMVEVIPGITPEADPDVLHEVLKNVDRLQFTGSSAMYKALVKKAYELGNLRLEHGGEVSGLNKVRLDGISVEHPAAAAGSAWAAMANNGELCTSASLLEFDPATGDTAEKVKAALEAHSFRLGKDPEDAQLDVLLKEGKTSKLEVMTKEPEGGFREWWEKTLLAVPQAGSPNVRTNQSLGHLVVAPTIERAVSLGVAEDASCIYCVSPPGGPETPSARAGTTGCKLPESAFGGMKSHTFAVAGDHDGVGSLQTLLNTVRRRGASWRDQEEVRAEYELTENAEMLLEFLGPQDQKNFPQQISNVLEVFAAFEPKVGPPYPGQALVGAEGRSQLVTLKALRAVRKSLLIPRGVGLPEEIVKMAILSEMSPLREFPIDLHLLEAQQKGKLRVTDPLKSFLRVVEKRLAWRLHYHADVAAMASALHASEYPPYFFCVKDRHVLPLDVLMAVAEKGGYFYEGLPTDALSLFRMLTCTQAWTVACTEAQVGEAKAVLEQTWQSVALREEPHTAPTFVQPTRREADIGGGFNAGLDPDDKDWGMLSDEDSSDSDDEDTPQAAVAGDKAAAPAAAKAETAEAKTSAAPAAAAAKAETK